MNEPKKILIIEDEDSLANVLEVKLKKEGYEVLIAEEGNDGFNQIKKWRPDLILLDIVMPKMDGYEVMEKINKEKIKIPVIVISNSGQQVEIEKIKNLGAVDYLIKTEFDPAEVIGKVDKFLNKSKSKAGSKLAAGATEEISTKEDSASSKKLNVKVLLVEDDSFLRDICAKKLIKEGFDVSEAIDGEQALKITKEFLPDIILLDIILPSIDGFEVLDKIRSDSDKKVNKIPIIMLSNLGQEDDIKKAMEMGANSYLIKAHFTTEEIVGKIKKELNIS